MNWREKAVFSAGKIFDPSFVPAPKPRLSGENLRRRQLERFSEIYRRAFFTNAFYRRKYSEAGLGPDSVKNFPDIAAVPHLTKEEFPALAESCRGPAVELASGGTGGNREKTRLGAAYTLKRYEMLLGLLYSIGWKLGDKTIALHPEEYGFFRLAGEKIKKPGQAAFDFFQQFVLYRIFHNRKNVLYGAEIFENGPDKKLLDSLCGAKLLLGRPDALLAAAFSNPPKAGKIICVGGVLSGEAKKLLGRAFGCEVFNLYASTELGYMALGAGGLARIDGENYLLGVEEGEIIATDFNNSAMPVIRYKTGDAGEIIGEEKEFIKINGRVSRFITSAGRRVYEAELIDYFLGFPEVRAFQISAGEGGIRLSLRPQNLGAKKAEQIAGEFAARFSQEKVSVDLDTPFVKSPSGKFVYINYA